MCRSKQLVKIPEIGCLLFQIKILALSHRWHGRRKKVARGVFPPTGLDLDFEIYHFPVKFLAKKVVFLVLSR